jgi:(2R)-sulfolactate sulfo-lyase subunit beta
MNTIASIYTPTTINLTGFRRENGRVGIRNHVVILPVDDLSNAAAEGTASLVNNTIALPHPYGRLQFGDDLELTFRTLIGAGRNPNVAAVVVIGIEPKWTERVVQGITATGKPVAGYSIERSGDLKTIEAAAHKAKEYVQWASEIPRQPIGIHELTSALSAENQIPLSGWPQTRRSGVF